jgi:hypothetical protein
MPKPKPPPNEPTVKLTREAAGRYRTDDGRFVVAQSGQVWYVTDTARNDELGQPVVIGPLKTLANVRDTVASVQAEGPVKRGGRRKG